MDHIDTLVKQADPVGPLPRRGADSPDAVVIWERVQTATASDATRSSGPGPRRPPRPRRARRVALPVMGAIAAVVAVVLQLLPTRALQPPTAAAAVLRHLAGAAAAAPSAPALRDDQWLQSEYRLSYLAGPSHGVPESAAVEAARAFVTVNADVWANDLSQSCSRQVVTSVAYTSPAGRRAWSTSGAALPSTPQPQCGVGFLGKPTQSPGALDVSGLPTDRGALAHALEAGTTRIPLLDKPFVGDHHLTPFGRAVTLLASPTIGATPALWSALLGAMATMPGVALLGNEATHSGTTGVALAGATGEGYRTTIVLSPSTGALLEARNLLVEQFVAGVGGSIGVVTIQWLDPSGVPHVVNASMLPASLAGQVPTGIVSAVADPGVTQDHLHAWVGSILAELPRHIAADVGATGTPGVFGVSVITLTPDPDIARITAQFQSSGLFHSVRSANG